MKENPEAETGMASQTEVRMFLLTVVFEGAKGNATE